MDWRDLACRASANGFQSGGIDADVVVLDDTSASMKNNDPQDAIVLVTRLLSDMVPGNLGAVPTFRYRAGEQRDWWSEHRPYQSLSRRPTRTCRVFSTGDLNAYQKVIGQCLLLKTRPVRGDAGFISILEELLRPSSMARSMGSRFA